MTSFIQMEPVTSSNLAAVGYDPEALVLVVQFKNGGRWRYFGVTHEEHAELMNSESIGRAFGALKATHTGEKLQ